MRKGYNNIIHLLGGNKPTSNGYDSIHSDKKVCIKKWPLCVQTHLHSKISQNHQQLMTI